MDETTEKMKQIEIELLKEFISVCQKLHLNYFIAYGTLLGAVRHKGFIPWDDDIDIVMLRADYETFLEKAPQYLREPFFLQTHKTDPNYFNCFAKLRNSNTTFIQKSVKNLKINHGIFLDIFPLDFYTKENHREFQWRKFVMDERIIMEIIPTRDRPLKCKLIRPYAKLSFPMVEQAYAEREKMFCSVQDGAYLADNTWGEKEIMPKEWFDEVMVMEFEGLRVNAPKEYDKILTQEYGDYMQLPPVGQRITLHDAIVIDPDKSYLDYMDWENGKDIGGR